MPKGSRKNLKINNHKKTTLYNLIDVIIKEELSFLSEQEGDASPLAGIQQDYYDSLGPGIGHGDSGNATLKSTFIDPFLDVGRTAMYALKTISAAARGYLKRLMAGVVSLVIPFIEADYKAMQQEEEQELGKIKSAYAPVLARNIEALRQNDVSLIAFLLDPSMLLGAKLLQYSPGFTTELLSVAGIGSTSSNSLHETVNKQQQEQFLDSPIAKQMQKDGVQLVLNHIKEFMSIKTIDELNQKMNNSLAQQIQAINQLTQQQKITENDRQIMFQQLVQESKNKYKEVYIKKFTDFASQHPNSKQAISNLVQQIQKLK